MEQDERERQAVRVAGELFAERGIQGTGVDAVRDATGLPLKRIYARFGTKEGLVVAALDEHAERDVAELHARTTAASDPRSAILAVFDLVGEWVEDAGFRGCAFLNAYAELGATSPPIAAAVREQKRAIRSRLVELVADAGAPATLADQLFVLVNGAMVTAALAQSTAPVHHARQAATVLADAAGVPGGDDPR